MNNDHRLGILAGIASGIIIGIVCSRRHTPSLRKLVARKAKGTLGDVKQFASDMADSAGEMVSKGKTKVDRRQEALGNAFDAGLKAYQKSAG